MESGAGTAGATSENVVVAQCNGRLSDEPDVVGWDRKSGAIIFFDCSTESLKGYRSLCYDRDTLNVR